MRHLVAALAIAAVLCLLALPAPAAERIALITVAAGRHERLDTPISSPLADLGNDPRPPWLQETTGGTKADVPAQVEPGDPPRLCWILSGRTAAGAVRTFEVWPIAKQAAAPPKVEVRSGDDGVDVIALGRKVLRYRHKMVEPPEGLEAVYRRNAYIHPLWTPSGLVVTDDFPPDHPHQKGVWFAWTSAEFEGRHLDFWNLGRSTAAIRFRKMGPTASGDVFGAFRTEHEHVDLAAPGGEKPVLAETWDVRAWNVGGPALGYWLWDMVSTQRCASASRLALPKYYYGGLGFRGAREWAHECLMRTSEGKTRTNGNETKARWVDVAGDLADKEAGVLILIHPANFRYPQPLRLNPDNPQICVAPSQEGPWAIEPGKDYVSRYRFCVHDGRVGRETAERLWADFAEPPDAKATK